MNIECVSLKVFFYELNLFTLLDYVISEGVCDPEAICSNRPFVLQVSIWDLRNIERPVLNLDANKPVTKLAWCPSRLVTYNESFLCIAFLPTYQPLPFFISMQKPQIWLNKSSYGFPPLPVHALHSFPACHLTLTLYLP